MKERRRGDGQQTGRVGGGGWERERERESCETRASVRAGRKRECESTHQLKSAPIDD